MLFNSYVFLIFIVIFFVIWPHLRPHKRLRWSFLTLASFVFYGWWDWRYLFLLIWTGLIDFSAGLAMERYPTRKKLLLAASLIGNVGSLAAFKYLPFFTSNLNFVLHALGTGKQLPIISLVLPIGISFYTFESLSYTIDVYKGHFKPTRNVLQFFSFLSLFPHLVAGPIIRPYDLLPQLNESKSPTPEQRWDGLRLIAHGYFKKVVIADNLAPAVNFAFGTPVPEHSAVYWWVATTMFAFQIYCDFSGYSDIARGLAKWLGYEFPVNFNHPYISQSFREFWTRWHISLSSWFRDYVYIPLGGSKGSKWQSHKNMWITMLVSGFWHGAAWNFIIWGGLHAFYLSFERISKWPERLASFFGGRLIVSILLLMQVWVAWVFFRADTFSKALQIVSIMFDFRNPGFHSLAGLASAYTVAGLFVGLAVLREIYIALGVSNWKVFGTRMAYALEPIGLALVLTLSVYWRGPGNAFIYFQF